MPISLSGSLLLTGSLTATSTITAQKLVVQVITSSIVNFTGSNTFGSSAANIQEMTGSLRVTGSGAHYILGGNVGIGTTTPGNYDPSGNNLVVYENGIAGITVASPSTSYGNLFFADNTGSAAAYAGYIEYNHNTDTMAFGTNSTERMRISGSGNVGIGTTTPTNILEIRTNHIVGANGIKINSTGSSANQAGIALAAGDGTTNRASRVDFINNVYSATVPRWTIINDYNQNGTNDLSIVNSDPTNRVLIISQSGNVGIGTTNPSYGKLSILDTNNTTLSSALWGTSQGAGVVAAVYNTSQTANSVAGLRLITRDSGASVWNIYNVSIGNDTGDLAFGNGSGGVGTEKMRITSAGNVGIGTTSSLQTTTNRTVLTVNGTNSSIVNLGVNGVLASYIYADANGGTYETVGTSSIVASGANRIDFSTNGSERMRITSGGNVGIGVTSPSYRLHVTESIYVTSGLTSTMFTARSNNGTGTSINFASSSPLGNTDNYTITHKMVHGTGYGYEISHDATTRYIRMVAGSGGVELLGTATAWTAVSDIRKKDILQTGIPNALEKIGGIDAIFYKYKNEELLAPGEVMPEMVEENKPTKIKQRRVGLVAQQVLSALPEAVNYSETEDVYKLSYTEVIPLMIEAIKELKAENTALKSRIEQLESKTQ